MPTPFDEKLKVVEQLLQNPSVPPVTLIVDGAGRDDAEPVIPAPNFTVSPERRLIVVETCPRTRDATYFGPGMDVSFTKHVTYASGTRPLLRSNKPLGWGVHSKVDSVTLEEDTAVLKATLELFARKVVRINEVSSTPGHAMKNHLLVEIEIPKQIKHPHIAEILTSYEEREGSSLIFGYLMRPVAQCTMRSLVDVVSGRNPPSMQPRWFVCIANAVSYLHEKGIAHGDIKPSNILYKDGEVYLADFRVTSVRTSLETSWPASATDSYTSMYASPEYAASGT